MSLARDDDEVVVVGCCSRGPVAVKATARPGWKCDGCGSFGTDVERLTLGPQRTLGEPPDWRVDVRGAFPALGRTDKRAAA